MLNVLFPVFLLTISNLFMTIAWYGHLKFKDTALWQVVLISWLIAFVEYCFQVPANRLGHAHFSAPQLKIIQEIITIVVFCAFSIVYLRETPRWNDLAAFACVMAAVVFLVQK